MSCPPTRVELASRNSATPIYKGNEQHPDAHIPRLFPLNLDDLKAPPPLVFTDF